MILKRRLLCVIFLFSLSSGMIWGQAVSSEVPGQKPSQTEIKPKDAIQEYNETNPNPVQETLPDSGSSFWGPFFFLLILAGILFVVLKYIRRKKAPALAEVDFFQSLGDLNLGNNSKLAIVEIGEKIYLLGVGSASVNLLMEIEDKDLILKLKTRPLAPRHKTFTEILGHVFEKKGKTLQFEKPKNFSELLKEKKDRLKKLL